MCGRTKAAITRFWHKRRARKQKFHRVLGNLCTLNVVENDFLLFVVAIWSLVLYNKQKSSVTRLFALSFNANKNKGELKLCSTF